MHTPPRAAHRWLTLLLAAASTSAHAQSFEPVLPSLDWTLDETLLGDNGLPSPPSDDESTESVCGDDPEWLELEDGTDDEQTWGRSVGQVRWNAGVGGSVSSARWCSGALIAPNLFLTAGHCFDRVSATSKGWNVPAAIQTMQDFCDNMNVQFNYQEAGGALPAAGAMPSFACDEVVDARLGGGHDYAVVRLAGGEPGNEFGYLEMNFRRPVPNETVTVIQHPAGMPKKVHSGSVLSTGGMDFSYDADTTGGSSGAPVIDDDGRVIGVHTNGGCNDFFGSGNTGRRLDAIHGDADILAETDWFDARVVDLPSPADQLGDAVVSGDFDGDGFDDVAAGQPGADIHGFHEAGAVALRYGSAFGLDPRRDERLTQTYGSSPESSDQFGDTLAAGDFDGDGYDDLVVGTPWEDWHGDVNAGMVQVYYGGVGGITQATASRRATWLAPHLLGGQTQANAEFGRALAVEDFDGDGYDDLAIGAPHAGSSAGEVYVVYGGAAGLSTTGADRFDQANSGIGVVEAGDRHGAALAAGDFNRDGRADLAIGAPGETPGGGPTQAGWISVMYGSAAGVTSAGSHGFYSSNGRIGADDQLGSALAALDFDGDGYDDLAYGVPEDDATETDRGSLIFRFGDAAGLHGSYTSFTPGYFSARNENQGRFGMSLAAADVNGDGREDLIVGSPRIDTSGSLDAGHVGVIYGGTRSTTAITADELAMPSAFDYLGHAVAGGDVDGDGDSDVIAGLPYKSQNGAWFAGAVLVHDLH